MSWRCFHCDETFTEVADAREHFGDCELDKAACQIKRHEGHLVHYIRKLEDMLASYRTESDDIMKSIMSLEDEHRRALIREEEKGYARGMADARAPEPAPDV